MKDQEVGFQPIADSSEILFGTGFRYLTKSSVKVLRCSEAEIRFSEFHYNQVKFQPGTTFRQGLKNRYTYIFKLPCSCRLAYTADGARNDETVAILCVVHFCQDHDGLTEIERGNGWYMADDFEEYDVKKEENT